MNATSRKVLQEVLMGLLITEPDVKGSRIRKKKIPWNVGGSRTKQICAWVPCADYSRERERERETSKKVPINNNIKGKKRMYVCMTNAW